MQNNWSSPSGSRWEPTPQADGPDPSDGSVTDPATEPRAATAGLRRRRRPVAAVLLTLVGFGAATGGAVYLHDGTAQAGPAAQSPQVAGGDAHRGKPDGEDGDREHRHGPRGGDEQPPVSSGASS